MARTQFTGETGTPNMKMLLPIKDKGRVIPKMMEVEESDDAAEEEEESAEEENCGRSLDHVACILKSAFVLLFCFALFCFVFVGNFFFTGFPFIKVHYSAVRGNTDSDMKVLFLRPFFFF